jgi:integrase
MFINRLKTVAITGISLHSYRYAWAERAKTVGMPERFAQQALGHSSKAFVRAYSKKGRVIVPSLEDYERKILPMPVAVNQ